MERSLKKQVSEKLHWIMSIQEMPTTIGLSCPVFEWSFGDKDGIRGGELRAFIHGAILHFERRRKEIPGPNEWNFDSVEKALAKINEYGWGKPPYINEVFQDILETNKKLPVDTKEKVEQIFKELRQKWKALVDSQFN